MNYKGLALESCARKSTSIAGEVCVVRECFSHIDDAVAMMNAELIDGYVFCEKCVKKIEEYELAGLATVSATFNEPPTQNAYAHIDKPFAYHKPSEDGFERITKLRVAFSDVKARIEQVCPESRQRSVALTELETAAMWAIKAVVFNDPNSEMGGQF